MNNKQEIMQLEGKIIPQLKILQTDTVNTCYQG